MAELAVWTALLFVPASLAFAFVCFCFVVSFFDLSIWLVVSRLQDYRTSSAAAFGPNDVTGEKKRHKTDGHKTPDVEHLPIRMVGFVRAWDARTFPIKIHISEIISLSMLVRSIGAAAMSHRSKSPTMQTYEAPGAAQKRFT